MKFAKALLIISFILWAWQRDAAAFKRWVEEKGKEIVRQIALKIYALTSEF